MSSTEDPLLTPRPAATTVIEYHQELKTGKKWDWRPTTGFEPNKNKKLPKGHPLSEAQYQQLWAYYTWLLDRYRERKEVRWFLHPGCILYLLEMAKKVVARDATLVEIELEKEPIKFFGNIYASFPDLVPKQVTFTGTGKALKMEHWPERGRTVYLGNIVNRGFHNVETLCFVLLQKCIWPDKVTILRGVEETRTFNRNGEFMDELIDRWRAPNDNLPEPFFGPIPGLNSLGMKDHIKKYTDNFPNPCISIYNQSNDVFDLLPLAVLYGKKDKDRLRVLCVSSGISEKLQSLDDITKIKRPIQKPFDNRLVYDLLTAQPIHGRNGFGMNRNDGFGWDFGADVLANCLTKLKLTSILRTNQTFSLGILPFPSIDDPKLVTITSCSQIYREHELDQGHPNLAVVVVGDMMMDMETGKKSFEFTRQIFGDMPKNFNEKRYNEKIGADEVLLEKKGSVDEQVPQIWERDESVVESRVVV